MRQKAIKLAKKGLNRTEIANELHAGYYSVLVWTKGINTWHKHLPYPPSLKRKARRMVRSGVPKMEVAARLSISRNALYDWTCDIHTANSRLTGAAEKILAEVVEKGYFFPKPAQLNICRILKQNVGLRLTRLNSKWILYAPSAGDKAMRTMLEKSRLNYLNSRNLTNIRRLFYARDT
jgi:transposase-like protein